MPGDELFGSTRGRPVASGTRSITIAAPPNTVFNFLAQMGFGKAGWYSYDWLDNLGRTSARHVRPEWLVTASGDAVPAGPIDFVAAVVDRPTAFVLQLPRRVLGGHGLDFSLGFMISEVNAGATRLASRVRIACSGPLGAAAEWGLLAGDGVMVRRQLLGVRERCEAVAKDR